MPYLLILRQFWYLIPIFLLSITTLYYKNSANSYEEKLNNEKAQTAILSNKILEQNKAIEIESKKSLENKKEFDLITKNLEDDNKILKEKIIKINKSKVPAKCEDAVQWGIDSALDGLKKRKI
jgi:hypothetical protein